MGDGHGGEFWFVVRVVVVRVVVVAGGSVTHTCDNGMYARQRI